MKKIFKIITGIIGLFILFYIAAMILLITFVHPNTYKAYLSALISKKLQREVTIAGNLNLHFLPWLSIDAHNILIKNAKNAPLPSSIPYFASINELAIKINFIHLFSGKIVPEKIIIHEPSLYLIKMQNGQNNWQMPEQSSPEKTSLGNAKPDNKPTDNKPINLPELVIDNADIHWLDLQKKSRMDFSNLNLYLPKMDHQKTLVIKFSTLLNQNNFTPMDITGKIAGNFNPNSEKFTFNKFNINSKKISLSLHAQGSLNLKTKTLSIAKFALQFQQIKTKGSLLYQFLSINNLQFNTHINSIDLNRFGPSTSATLQQPAKLPTIPINNNITQPATVQSNNLPIAWIKTIKLQGEANIDTLLYHNITLHNIQLNLLGKPGTIDIQSLAALGDGSITSQDKISVKNNTALISMNVNGKNLALKNIIPQKFNNSVWGLDGKLHFAVALHSFGNNETTWKQHLAGSGNIAIDDGVLRGIDLNYWINSGIAFLQKKSTTSQKNTQKTTFQSLNTQFTVNNETVNNQAITLTSQHLNATGNGTLNLSNNQIHYQISATSSANANLPVPMMITGTINQPKFGLDLRTLGETLLKTTVQKNINETLTRVIGKNINLQKLLP